MSRKMLIVEDEKPIADILQYHFQKEGFSITCIYNGEYHSNVQAMRITIPEEGYEIIMIASLLTKEEMENILLSMVGK